MQTPQHQRTRSSSVHYFAKNPLLPLVLSESLANVDKEEWPECCSLVRRYNSMYTLGLIHSRVELYIHRQTFSSGSPAMGSACFLAHFFVAATSGPSAGRPCSDRLSRGASIKYSVTLHFLSDLTTGTDAKHPLVSTASPPWTCLVFPHDTRGTNFLC